MVEISSIWKRRIGGGGGGSTVIPSIYMPPASPSIRKGERELFIGVGATLNISPANWYSGDLKNPLKS